MTENERGFSGTKQEHERFGQVDVVDQKLSPVCICHYCAVSLVPWLLLGDGGEVKVPVYYYELVALIVFTHVCHPPPRHPSHAVVVVQAYSKAKEAGKDLEVVYVPVADSLEVRTLNHCFSSPPRHLLLNVAVWATYAGCCRSLLAVARGSFSSALVGALWRMMHPHIDVACFAPHVVVFVILAH